MAPADDLTLSNRLSSSIVSRHEQNGNENTLDSGINVEPDYPDPLSCNQCIGATYVDPAPELYNGFYLNDMEVDIYCGVGPLHILLTRA